ncbi:MAG: hypothetical protein MEQ74_05040 [Paracoccus sp.]|nr:hypothetical protein [Paracoccus sp. (in: a-proteobacteria)]
MPTLRVDATGIAAATRKTDLHPLQYLQKRTLHCPNDVQLKERERIGAVLRFTKAGADSLLTDPLVRSLCGRLHGELSGLPDAWESKTNYRWSNGEMLGMKRADEVRGKGAALLNHDALYKMKSFMDAERMMHKILRLADDLARKRERAYRDDRLARGRERVR